MSTAMWKLEKDLCRCCHAEGSFKHLSDPCFQLGQEEVYSDMLQDSLDIKIVPITGVLSDVTYTICDSCVVRLRDASNFKRQVLDCEERFKDMYSKNLIKCAGSVSPDYEVKEEPMASDSDGDMKQEYQSIEDEDDDDAFMKFDDEDSLDLEERQELITIEIKSEPKGKGKGKAKPKPKPKKETPIKKAKTIKEKPIKLETEELTEAAVSGEKKKGESSDYLKYCTVYEEDDSTVYSCNICEKTFKKRDFFRQHYVHVHLKMRKRTYSCVICSEELVPWLRAKHMEEMHGWEAPTCDECGKKFSFQNKLIKHQKAHHMGVKNFQCDKCVMAFADAVGLRRHYHKHSNVRNYTCVLCSKAFKTQKYLATHMKIHLNDKRYVCKICDDAFVQYASLKYHMAKRHANT